MATHLDIGTTTYIQEEMGHRAVPAESVPLLLRVLGDRVCPTRFNNVRYALFSLDKTLSTGVRGWYTHLDSIEEHNIELAALLHALAPLTRLPNLDTRDKWVYAVEDLGAPATICNYWEARERPHFIFPKYEELPLAA